MLKTKVMSKKPTIIRNEQEIPRSIKVNPDVSKRSKQMLCQKNQPIPRGINVNPVVSSRSKQMLCQKNRQFLKLSDNLTSWRSHTS